MKKLLFKVILVLSFIFLTNLTFTQDIIVLKNGDEIKSKVLEVTPDLIKYKNWENQEGPTYSKSKSEIFMIKYSNGSKDVFATNSISEISNSENSSNAFIGTWYHKKYDGKNNKTLIIISKAMNNFLVEYKRYERVDAYFYSADGSFKEVGSLENGSIIINSFTKLSLLNKNTLLMNSEEFHRTPNNSQNQNSSQNKGINNMSTDPLYLDRNEIKLISNHVGYFNHELPKGTYKSFYLENYKFNQQLFYKNIFYKAQFISIDLTRPASFGGVNNYESEDLIVKQGDSLLLNLNITGLLFSRIGSYGIAKAKYSLAIQIEDSTGKKYFSEIANKEFIQLDDGNYSINVYINVNPERLLLMPTSQDLFLSFLIKDSKEKDRILQGFAKFKILK